MNETVCVCVRVCARERVWGRERQDDLLGEEVVTEPLRLPPGVIRICEPFWDLFRNQVRSHVGSGLESMIDSFLKTKTALGAISGGTHVLFIPGHTFQRRKPQP